MGDLEGGDCHLEVDHEGALAAVRVDQRSHAAVVDDSAVVDHDQPPAEPLHVGEVVRGEQHGHAPIGVDRRKELPHARL